MTNTESTGHHSPTDRELIDALANRVAVLEAKLASEGLTDAEIDELGELDADAAEQADDEPMTLRELRDERDRLDGIADELRESVRIARERVYPTLAHHEGSLRAVIAQRDALTSRIRRAMAVEPTRAGERGCGARSNGSAAGFTCTRDADHEGDHVAHGEHDRAIATWPRDVEAELDASIHEAAEHDLEAFRVRTDRLDAEQLDRLAAAVGGALTKRDADDALIDMTGAFVKSTAAILAIRAGMQYRADAARRAWLLVQHGKRGERWAAARERASVLADVLAEIDAVIASRLS